MHKPVINPTITRQRNTKKSNQAHLYLKTRPCMQNMHDKATMKERQSSTSSANEASISLGDVPYPHSALPCPREVANRNNTSKHSRQKHQANKNKTHNPNCQPRGPIPRTGTSHRAIKAAAGRRPCRQRHAFLQPRHPHF